MKITMKMSRPLKEVGTCCAQWSSSSSSSSSWRVSLPSSSFSRSGGPAARSLHYRTGSHRLSLISAINEQSPRRGLGLVIASPSLGPSFRTWALRERGEGIAGTTWSWGVGGTGSLGLGRERWKQKTVVRYSTSKQTEEGSSKSSSEKDPEAPISPAKPLLKVFGSLTPHENIYTIPNILTFSRLIAAPVVGYLVLHDYHAWALGLFAYAGITDLVDGWIARRWNLQTVVGTVIDPMADKTLMTILTVCLAIKGSLPIWLAGIILGRDVGLAITAIYYRWISLPPPKTFARYWDFSLPSAEVHPTTISKYNTALQLALIGATTALPLVTVDVSAAMTAMQYLVATTTIWSGASYIYTKDAVKILNQEDKNSGRGQAGGVKQGNENPK